MKRLSGGNRIVLLTVSMIVLAGVVVGAASYLRTRSLADNYDNAMEAELQQKGLAYAQSTSNILNLFKAVAPESIDVLLQKALADPQGILTRFVLPEEQSQNAPQGFQIWTENAPASGGYSLAIRQDVAGGAPARRDSSAIAQVLARAEATGRPVAGVDEADHLVDYAFQPDLPGQPKMIVVVTLDASHEFAFIAAQRQRATRDAILFAAGSVVFVALVGIVLSALVSRTLTNRHRAEDAIRTSELRWRTLAELSPVGIFRLDTEGNNIYSNRTALELLDLPEEASLGEGWATNLHPDDRERVFNEWAATMRQHKPYQSEYRFVRRDGAVVWALGQIAPEQDTHGTVLGYVGTATDITDRKVAEERLREEARRDPLTGLLNHASIVEELRRRLDHESGADFALAMVDIDGMKAINDTHGHLAGDEALRTVSRALQRHDATVGRYGGDEFIAILPAAGREAVALYKQEVLAELARTALQDPDTRAHILLSVTIGLAMYPDEADAVVDLIKLADSQMYAQRRQRPLTFAPVRPRRSAADELAARLIGECVPLLTSPGHIRAKLHYVAQRLLLGLDVDAVTTVLFAPQPGGPALSSSVARLDQEIVRAWDAEQGKGGNPSVMRALLEQVQRPFIIDDLTSDDRLSPTQRELLSKAEIRAGLIVPMVWQGHSIGALAVGSRQAAAFGTREAQILASIAGQVTAIVRMETLVEDLQATSSRLTQAQEETVMLLAAAAEAHGNTTGEHLRRMRLLVEALARELGETEEAARDLGLAAALHDIGKLFVPESVLSNSGTLDEDAWALMRTHSIRGQAFLAGQTGLELAAVIARSHHERWDGRGYPDGLAAEQLPEAVTIVTVADAFDAMTSDRRYRPARSAQEAIAEIITCSGTQFAPRVVDALVRLYQREGLPAGSDDSARLAA